MKHVSNQTHIGAVTLRVSDLERSVAFYEGVLGLRTLERSDEGASFAAGNQVLVRAVAVPDAPPRKRAALGLYHFAILVPDRPSLARILRRLANEGWRLSGASDHDVSEALYLADPDGHGIEIYRDRPREEWSYQSDGELYMTTRSLDVDDLLQAAKDAAPLPDGTRMGHIHLHVSNLARARAFYVEELGFDVTVSGYPGALFLSVAGYHHHVGLNTWAGAGAAPPDGRSIEMIEFEIIDPSTGEEMRLEDPDGIRIRIRS